MATCYECMPHRYKWDVATEPAINIQTTARVNNAAAYNYAARVQTYASGAKNAPAV